MKRFIVGLASAVLTLGLIAAGGPHDKVTGGGQILVDSNGIGAGSTIAFNARSTDPNSIDARGQVQWIDREAGAGQDQVKKHGTVICLRVEDDRAVLGGVFDRQDGEGEEFEIHVFDAGEGEEVEDMIVVNDNTDADCDDIQEDELDALARGNVQVHDASENND